MHARSSWAFATFVTIIVVLPGCKEPEEKLAGHLDEMSELLEDHQDDPEAGIKALRSYLRENLPDMAEAVGELIGELDSIEGSAARNDRIDAVIAEVGDSVKKWAKVSKAFGKAAAEGGHDTKALVEFAAEYAVLGELATEGPLAAVTNPFGGYAARAKTTEAIDYLDKIYKGSASYYSTPMVSKTGERLPCQFPKSVRLTPALVDGKHPCCADGGRCRSGGSVWSSATWSGLNFGPDEHLFAYEYESEGAGPTAKFTASAYADLDCDGVFSTFQRYGYGDEESTPGECYMTGSSAFYKDKETE